MNLYAAFKDAFPADPEAPFLEQPDGVTLTYGELDQEVARMHDVLATLGLAPGDRVTLQVEKSVGQLILYLACLRGGFVFQPLNTAYLERELAHFLGDAAPVLVICRPQDEALWSRIAADKGVTPRIMPMDVDGHGPLEERAARAHGTSAPAALGPDALACLIYSSGTTGQPKGVMITHGNLLANARSLIQAWGFNGGDLLLHTLPLFHVHGLFVALHTVLLSGARLRFLPRFDARAVLAHLPSCTVFMGVPTYYTRLLEEPGFTRDLAAGMRLFVSGSAPLLAETFAAFAERIGQPILERYGMTETGMNASNPLLGERRAGSVGLALPGVEIRVADAADGPVPTGEVGEVQVRGENVTPGYWHLPDKTAESFAADGFFRTGDLGRLSADGYLTIVGRAKDMVITGGLNVYPSEVEAVIDAIPGVLESAVFGVPHADFGEAVTAAVVPRPEAELSEAGLLAVLKGELASFKLPKRIHIVADLPRNTMGKVQKASLRQTYGAGTKR